MGGVVKKEDICTELKSKGRSGSENIQDYRDGSVVKSTLSSYKRTCVWFLAFKMDGS